MSLFDIFFQPFIEFGFMRRSLVACLALSMSAAPLGLLLILRRMSLLGEAMSHAMLPGAAIAFALAGFSLLGMGLGAFLAGLSVALLSAWLSRITQQNEDASFAAFYLIALALGVLIMSSYGSPIDLMHVLFGSVLAVDHTALGVVASSTSLTLIVLAIIYRPLITQCLDPGFLQNLGGPGAVVHLLFLLMVVLNLMAGFLALGTLMSVGLMVLPALSARCWATDLGPLFILAYIFAGLSALAGLLFSFHFDWPSGPSIILITACFYAVSVVQQPIRKIFLKH